MLFKYINTINLLINLFKYYVLVLFVVLYILEGISEGWGVSDQLKYALLKNRAYSI